MATTRCCLFFLCYFFYRFSDTYAQPIGFYDMHPLSVKCRRFDTSQLLLPFNGPIKLFHSYPFDQSDATTYYYSFFLIHSTGKCLSTIIIGNMFFSLYIFVIKQSTNQSYLIIFLFYRNALRVKDKIQLFFPSRVVTKSR